MEYRIDREALDEFISRQVELIESVSVPRLLEDVVELRLRHESVGQGEVRALWLGAGLATHVGLAIFEEPGASSPPSRHPLRRSRRSQPKHGGGDMQTMTTRHTGSPAAERPLWIDQTRRLRDTLRTIDPSEAHDAAAMIAAAGLDWTVEQHRLEAVVAAERVPVPRQVANVRSDTRAVLGVVGEVRAAPEPAGVRLLRRDHRLRAGALDRRRRDARRRSCAR